MQKRRTLNGYMSSNTFKLKDLSVDSSLLFETPSRFFKEINFLDKPYFIEVSNLDVRLEKRGELVTFPSVPKLYRNEKDSFTLSVHITPSLMTRLLEEKGFKYVKKENLDQSSLTDKERSLFYQENVIMCQIQKDREETRPIDLKTFL